MNTKLKELTKDKNIIIINNNDIYYLTKFISSNALILITKNKSFFFTDGRYLENAKKNIKNFEIFNISKFFEILKNIGDKFYINPNDIKLSTYMNWKTKFLEKKINLEIFDYKNIRINDGYDIEKLIESSKIADNLFKKIIHLLKIGITEKELFKKIINLVNNSENVEKVSFDPIVAFGESTSNPHWQPSNKKLKNGDFITIDFGIFHKNFASDMTRSFIFGNNYNNKNDEYEKIFDIVNEARIKAIELIKPGIKFSDVDKIAREYIEKFGFEKEFMHSIGHGLGIEIHDFPNLSKYPNEKLEEGMVITIEPGIYLKNKFGIRIEDAILVTKNGYKILNKTKIFKYFE